MDEILTSPYKIPRRPFDRELSRLDPALFKPVPPALQSIWPLLKAIYRQTKRREPEKTTPTPASRIGGSPVRGPITGIFSSPKPT
jgi:hypothetical protein